MPRNGSIYRLPHFLIQPNMMLVLYLKKCLDDYIYKHHCNFLHPESHLFPILIPIPFHQSYMFRNSFGIPMTWVVCCLCAGWLLIILWVSFHQCLPFSVIQRACQRVCNGFTIARYAKQITATTDVMKANVTWCHIEMPVNKEYTKTSIITCFIFEKSEQKFVRKLTKQKHALTTKASTLNSNSSWESLKCDYIAARIEIKSYHWKSVVLGILVHS